MFENLKMLIKKVRNHKSDSNNSNATCLRKKMIAEMCATKIIYIKIDCTGVKVVLKMKHTFYEYEYFPKDK